MPIAALWDSLWIDLSLATLEDGAADGYGAVSDAAVGVKDGKIVFAGPRGALPGPMESLAAHVHSGGGGWMTPGLIDAHTHLVYGGNRAREFEMRLQGASYEEIARAGGGIVSTVAATRAADEDSLLAAALPRLDSLLAEGVTTVEIKSGYGLDTASEMKMLRVARRLAEVRPVDVRATFLGAHAVPPERRGDPDGYIDQLCAETLPAVAKAGLADAVDAFCEGIGFSIDQTRRVFEAARAHGLPVKLHAEQLSNLGGAKLVAAFGGLSADHIEHLDEAGVVAMARAGTAAVLLPGAFYALRETKLPPIDLLRRHGVPMALSTDNNPGTSPVCSLLLMLSMGCTFFRLTPAEALAGVTRCAARALGLTDRGVIAPGMRADLVLWGIDHPAELSYAIGLNPCRAVVNAGIVRAPRILS
jgi:imidazolonepropionase